MIFLSMDHRTDGGALVLSGAFQSQHFDTKQDITAKFSLVNIRILEGHKQCHFSTAAHLL